MFSGELYISFNSFNYKSSKCFFFIHFQISLFTSGLKYSSTQLLNVISTDNTDHSKDTVVAYECKMLQNVPKNNKAVKIWSDGPRQQFKNKYVGSMIKPLEKLFGFKIV